MSVFDLPRYLPLLAPPVLLEFTVLATLTAPFVQFSPPRPLSGLVRNISSFIGLPVAPIVRVVPIVVVPIIVAVLACLASLSTVPSTVPVIPVVVCLGMDIICRGEAMVYWVPWIRGTLNWLDVDGLHNHDDVVTWQNRPRSRSGSGSGSWIFTVFNCGLRSWQLGLGEVRGEKT